MARAVEIAYDYRNQMVEYKDLDNLRTHRYHYDRRVAVATCFGRRVAKVVDHQNGGMATRFVYGGQASWQVLAEFDGFQPWDTAPLATYVFGNYISKSRRGDDEPIQMRRDLDGPSGGQQPQDFYYHPDDLFSVVAITDAGGAVVERVRYGDYGNVAVTDASGNILGDTSTIGNRFAFTGREYDEETDLSYYRTRYLEHEWGRFTTRDTIGTWGDSNNAGNGASYCASSPSVFYDPLGLVACGERANRVSKRRFPGVGGHEWIEIDRSTKRGFYPDNGKGPGSSGKKNTQGPGRWHDEDTIGPFFHPIEFGPPRPIRFSPEDGGGVNGPGGGGMPRREHFEREGQYYEWAPRKRCSGSLPNGKSCVSATDDDIVSCLLNKTRTDNNPGSFSPIGGNCRDHARDALSACCLSTNGADRTHSPGGGTRWVGPGVY